MAFTTRSRPARAAILAAARQRFAREGYERTTIRSVAADAGVDPSMVMRYYGTKDDLFGAAVAVDLDLPDVAGLPPEEVAGRLARHFVARWEGNLADEAILLLLRSAVTNPAAAERMRAVFAAQVVPLVRAATDDARDSDVRAGLIASQLLGLALTRHVLRLPAVALLEAETLIECVTPALRHLLADPLPPGAMTR